MSGQPIESDVARPRLAIPPRGSRTSDSPLHMPTGSDAMRALGRVLRLHCPHCGLGYVLTKWGGVRERCSGCALRFERTDDNYFGGAMFFGMMLGEGFVALSLLVVVLLTWPDVPWNGLQYGATAACILTLPLLLPFAKVVWLAVDVLVRPVQPEEQAQQ